MANKIRVGIISAQWGVWAHLPAWRSIDGVEVTAICTSRQVTADKAAQENGIAKAYGNYRDMAADPELDIIDVGTRPHLRFEMVMQILRAGKHVYAGIPFVDSLNHARQVLALQQSTGLIGVTDAYTQWIPQVSHMKELVDEGYLGDLWGFTGRFHLQLFHPDVVNVPDYAWFWEKKTGASVLRNLGSHLFNALVHLFGPVESVVADLRRILPKWQLHDGTTLNVETHDHASLLVRLKNGVTGVVDLSWAGSDGQGFQISAHGSRGRLEVTSEHFPGPLDTTLRGSQSSSYENALPVKLETPERLRFADGVAINADADVMAPVFPMARSMQAMTGAVRTGGQSSAPDFAQATHVHAVIEAAERSMASGAWCVVENI